jgi:hypothetical protein
MGWVKKSKGGGNFLRFEDGKVYEGVFQGATEKPSPFNPGTMIWDYRLVLDGDEKILSSSSESLKSILPITPVGTTVRIEMKIKGGRKIYDVYMNE